MKEIYIFTSKTCAPCKRLKSELKQNDRIKYVDVESPFAVTYNIHSVPCTLFMEHGVVINQINGYSTKLIKDIEGWLS